MSIMWFLFAKQMLSDERKTVTGCHLIPQSLTRLQLFILFCSSQCLEDTSLDLLQWRVVSELPEQSVCRTGKSLRGKGLTAGKQEGPCPYIVSKVTSRETSCKVRGNSPSTWLSMCHSQERSLSWLLSVLENLITGKEPRAGRPASLVKLGQISTSIAAGSFKALSYIVAILWANPHGCS